MRANPIGVRTTPSSPQTDDAKKDPNADGADQAAWPMAGILAKPPRAGFENEIRGLRQGGIPRGLSFPTARCGFGPVGIQGAGRSVRGRVLPFGSCRSGLESTAGSALARARSTRPRSCSAGRIPIQAPRPCHQKLGRGPLVRQRTPSGAATSSGVATRSRGGFRFLRASPRDLRATPPMPRHRAWRTRCRRAGA